MSVSIEILYQKEGDTFFERTSVCIVNKYKKTHKRTQINVTYHLTIREIYFSKIFINYNYRKIDLLNYVLFKLK